MAAIKLHDISAAEGEKVFESIKVGEWADGSAVGVPVHIVNGREAGPVVAVTAAIHGDEVVGTDAVRRITSELDPARLRGAVVGIPILNTPSCIVNAAPTSSRTTSPPTTLARFSGPPSPTDRCPSGSPPSSAKRSFP